VAVGDRLQGRTLGDFVLREKVGEGQFASVYRAEQPTLAREAVVKILHERHRSSATNIQRFMREARLAAQLDHPYGAHVYTFGAETDGLLWIAMERVRGTPLQQLLGLHGRLPLERFVPLAAQLCEVLETAHEQGIVHRDIKPANIMVIIRGGRWWPKLLDFGVAKLLLQDEDEAALATMDEGAASDARLTDTRAHLGSPAYMAPELWRRIGDADARSDLYALGITAYEALTGRLPFTGESLLALGRAHAALPLPRMEAHLPEAVYAVLARATAKQPRERYASVAELAHALKAAAGLDETRISLPLLDEAHHPTWLLGAPQPLAEAVAALEAAGSTHKEYEAVVRLVHVVAHWLGVVALACRAQGGEVGDDGTIAGWLRALEARALGDEQWLELGGDACRPFAARPVEFPLPELVALFCPRDGDRSFGEQLLRLRAQARKAATAPAADARAEWQECRLQLSAALERLSFVTDYELVVPRVGRGERWMGVRRLPRPTMARPCGCVEGEPLLMSRDGELVARLFPLAQVAAPAPGATDELFLLAGAGRYGGKLVSLPTGFQRHDRQIWHWLGKLFSAGEHESGQAGDDQPPYCGLSAFTRGDADRFFGREKEAVALVNRLHTQPLLTVVGPSGAGKSSLVQAGVIPALPESYHALVARPGLQPMATLLARLKAEGWLDDHRPPPADDAALVERLCRRARERGQTLLVVIDQFEELFTCGSAAEPAQPHRYARLVAALASSAEAPLRVVLTLRDDFLMRTQALAPLSPHLEMGLQLCATPGPADLLRIIREPARRSGYRFEPEELPLEIVQAVAHEPSALALVSFTASKMWELRDRERRLLTRQAYDALGGVGGALAQHAEETLGELASAEARRVRETFRHLVTADGTRAVLGRDELQQLIGGGAAAAATIERLVATRLLTTIEGTDGPEQIEIVHEALLSAWPRLVDWRREDAEGARLRDQLRAAARKWAEHNRARELLWRNDELIKLKLWRKRHAPGLTATERAFADASILGAERARRLRIGVAAAAFALLGASVAVARARTHKAQHRLGEQYEEEGRRAYLDGKATRAMVYLQEAAQLGVDGPARRYLFAAAADAALTTRQLLIGHGDALRSLQFSPDGSRLLTASSDQSARTWDVHSGRALATLVEPAGLIRAMFSPDGTRIATAGESTDSAQLFDARTGAHLATFAGHRGWVQWVDFRADGARLVTACADGVARIFEVSSGRLWRELVGHKDGIRFAAFSADGVHVLTTSLDSTARLWDADTGRVRAVLAAEAEVLIGAFSPDSRTFVFGDVLGNLYVADSRDGKLQHRLDGHGGRVRMIEFSADGRLLGSASDDGSVRIWDARSGQLVTVLRHDSGSLLALAFSPDGQRVVTAGNDGTARLWHSGGGLEAVLEGHRAGINAVAFSPDGALLATASSDGSARLWPIDRARQMLTLRTAAEPLTVRLSPDGRRVLVGYDDGHLIIYDAASQARLADLRADSSTLTIIALSRDGRRVLAAGADGVARVFDSDSGALELELRGHERGIENVAFSLDGRRIGTASRDGTARVWNADNGAVELVLRGHSSMVTGIDFSPDGRKILTTSLDRSSRIWDGRSGAALRTTYHASGLTSAHFSCDGSRIVIAENNSSGVVEDAASGAERGELIGHLGQLMEAIWSPGCERIATAGRDGTMRLWDAQTYRLLYVRTLGGRPMNDLAFDRAGARIVVGGDGAARVFALPRWEGTARAAAALVRCRAPFRFSDGNLVPASPDQQACAGLGLR
jgi:WD40 repeat protein/tRNA A-37 threonylcarbamoyl transferase component Bud32